MQMYVGRALCSFLSSEYIHANGWYSFYTYILKLFPLCGFCSTWLQSILIFFSFMLYSIQFLYVIVLIVGITLLEFTKKVAYGLFIQVYLVQICIYLRTQQRQQLSSQIVSMVLKIYKILLLILNYILLKFNLKLHIIEV